MLDNLINRLNIKNEKERCYDFDDTFPSLEKMQTRLNLRGGPDQWTRMREDKLRSLKRALLSSYQSAIVQKYNVKNNKKANNIIAIITKLQDKQVLSEL